MKRHAFKFLVKTAALMVCIGIVSAFAAGCKAEKTISITLDNTAVTLLAGQTQAITPTVGSKPSDEKSSWSTSNKAVATVDGKGLVAAVGAGTCKITYMAGKKSKASCTVKVISLSDIKVSFDSDSVSVVAGNTQKLQPKILPEDVPAGASVSWASSNQAIAAVDGTGTVTGVKAGTCDITYTYGGKISAVCHVAVTPSSNKTTTLMFHSILYQQGNILRIPPEKFDVEMKWLHDNNYATLSMDELYDHMVNKKPFPQKSVVVTLDDGYVDNYNNAFPILKKYNIHATIFMIAGKIGTGECLNEAQLKEMDASGLVDIQCHTMTHPYLNELSYDQQVQELKDSKDILEKLLNKKIEYLAYPTGKYNSDTIKIAQSLGYKMCFRMEGGTGSLSSPLYEFPRAFVGEDLDSLINAATGHGN